MVVTTTHNDVLLFTSRGRVFAIKGHLVPETKTGKGRKVSQFISLTEGETVVTMMGRFPEQCSTVVLITRRGISQWKNKATDLSFTVSAGEEEKYGYLRVRAYALDDSEEKIYTQPMMLVTGPTMIADSSLDRPQEASVGWSADGSL